MSRPHALTSPTPPENAPHSKASYRRYKHLLAFMKAVVEAAPSNCKTLRSISQAAGLSTPDSTIRRLSAGIKVQSSVIQKISEWSGVSYDEFKKNAGPDDVYYTIPGTSVATSGPPGSDHRYKHVMAFMQAVVDQLPLGSVAPSIVISHGAGVLYSAVSNLRSGRLNRVAIQKISEWSGIAYQPFKASAGPDDLFYATSREARKIAMQTKTTPADSPVDTIAASNPELRLISAMLTYSVGLSPEAIERALQWFRSYRGLDKPTED